MGAGAGAQKITTDVTGNDTAGMVAGMVASGVTAINCPLCQGHFELV